MRKSILFSFFVFFIITTGFTLFKNSNNQIPDDEKVVNELLKHTALQLQKKYKMNPIATSVAMPEGVIKLLGLDFQICGPLNKEEIRKILIDSAHELLTNINTNTKIKSYLANYPFTIKDVEINLFIVDANRREIKHPAIGIAGITRGELDYLTLFYTDIPNKVTECTESYEEAVALVKNTQR